MTGINRQPSGLLDFLQVQAGGRNPDDLAQTVRPVVDIEPFYWPDRLRGFNESFSLTSGQIEAVTVPAGQVWKLLTVGHVTTDQLVINFNYVVTYGIEGIPGQGLNGIEFGAYSSGNLQPTTGYNGAHFVQLPVPLIVTSGQVITLTCVIEGVTASLDGTFEGIFVLLQD